MKKEHGEVITFYSYKGGTGRTMSLANIAYLLSVKNKKRVLMIDWDMEAPGLFLYFKKYCNPQHVKKEGLIEFMNEANKTLGEMPFGKEDSDQIKQFLKKIHDYIIPVNIKNRKDNLFLLKAGNEDEGYTKKIQNFNWIDFFRKIPTFFTFFADYLSKHFDYILIDSRTGHTDIGGICTMLMPDKLVLVFTPNNQSLEGVLKLAKKAVKYRRGSFDLRHLSLYPLPSRVDLAEEELKTEWEEKYKKNFRELFEDMLQVPWISLDSYFNKVQIRHTSKYAYGEEISTITDNPEDIHKINSLQQAYNQFTIQLVDTQKIWEEEPYARVQEDPLKVLAVYADEDKQFYKELRSYLGIIERQRGINFSHYSEFPINEWNGKYKGIKEQNFDIIIEILTPNLYRQQPWRSVLNEESKTKVLSILAKPVDVNNQQIKRLIPTDRKAISTYQDEDVAWLDVMKEIRYSILDTIYDKLKTPTHA